jgi:hypothetical protein
MQYYHKEYKNNSVSTKEVAQAVISNREVARKPKAPQNNVVSVELYSNKWEQILKAYPRVHITEGAESVLIKPKDTMVLSEKYHELSSNSFLLHAYYNYRQLLLFRYIDSGEYYIGVPGIYYERQRRIAMMFGFEGFEGGNEDGGFGYFMKKVEI